VIACPPLWRPRLWLPAWFSDIGKEPRTPDGKALRDTDGKASRITTDPADGGCGCLCCPGDPCEACAGGIGPDSLTLTLLGLTSISGCFPCVGNVPGLSTKVEGSYSGGTYCLPRISPSTHDPCFYGLTVNAFTDLVVKVYTAAGCVSENCHTVDLVLGVRIESTGPTTTVIATLEPAAGACTGNPFSPATGATLFVAQTTGSPCSAPLTDSSIIVNTDATGCVFGPRNENTVAYGGSYALSPCCL
jgi:hypothetical protein